ncbi:hypothetical protein [Streptomyces sp. NPDC000994]
MQSVEAVQMRAPGGGDGERADAESLADRLRAELAVPADILVQGLREHGSAHCLVRDAL